MLMDDFAELHFMEWMSQETNCVKILENGKV